MLTFLSVDIESTGLQENDECFEFSAILIQDGVTLKTFHQYIKVQTVPSPWVEKHLKKTFLLSQEKGVAQEDFIQNFLAFLQNHKNLILLGKSLNALDIPFLKKVLGYETFYKYFSHRTLDLTSIAIFSVLLKKIPDECLSGAHLNKFFNLGKIAHTALEDSENNINVLNKFLEFYSLKE